MAKTRDENDPRFQEFMGIERHIIDRYKRLKSVQLILDRQYGAGNWGDEQVVAYITTSRTNKVLGINISTDAKRKARKEHIKVAETRLDKYLEHFDNVTPNDLQSLKQLCEIEVELENIARRRAEGGLKIDDLRKLAEMETKLSAEHRQLQTTLGIARTNRETEVDVHAVVDEFVDGARKLLRERSTKISCPVCTSAINQGYIMFHFRDDVPWSWTSQCPRCGKEFTLIGKVEQQPQVKSASSEQ